MVGSKNLKRLIAYIKKNFKTVEVLQNKTFKDLTTFKIGGKIRALVEIREVTILMRLIKEAKRFNVPYFILGYGSNILASDRICNYLVLKICLEDMSIRGDRIICGAGVGLFKLNNFARDNNLSGLEWSFGIPGSVGGAVKMNAGSFGKEMKDVIESVYFTDGNKIFKKQKEGLNFSYRQSFFSNNNLVILKAVFKLMPLDCQSINSLCLSYLEKRKSSQPYNLPSAGSIFKKPKDNFAPVLIENCKLKGVKKGGAQISSKHCGFIVNAGYNATFRQVFYLINKIKRTISKKFDIILEEEIIILR